MQILTRRLSKWLYKKNSFVKAWRSKRMQDFLSLVKPPNGARILDLGGNPYLWELFDHNYNVTLLNLPGSIEKTEQLIEKTNCSKYKFVEGDATDLSGIFEDKSFDIVFSNSVIEHVGNEEKQVAFASEVRRLAEAYWIQTPSDRFPIETHTGVPFYWNLPQWYRDYLHQRWQKKLPVWTLMIRELGVLSKKRMFELFPDSEIYVERKLIFEKSYSFYKPFK